jgi:L-fuculose-phosphate aldolase
MSLREAADSPALLEIDGERDTAARNEVLAGARTMLREGLVVGMVGNLSRRVRDRILITPSRVPYLRMERDDLVLVDPDGAPQGPGRPSIELALHLAVYRRRSEVGAVVHTHSPQATAWSFLGEPLLPVTEENRYYGIGPVRTSPPARSGSAELAAAAAETQGDSAAVLLGEHGVLATGPSVEAALDVARVVERQAEIAWILRRGGE